MKINNSQVEVRPLEIKRDIRGWLMEVLRQEDLGSLRGFGQLFVTVANAGFVKGNHYHTRKREWFCAIQGDGKIYIENNDSGKRDEILIGERNPVCVSVPPYHTHAIKNEGPMPLCVLVYISEPFNRENADTFPRKII